MFAIFYSSNKRKISSQIFRENGAGFTIIELLVSIAIFSLLIFITVAVLENVFFNSDQQFSSLSNIDHAQLVTNQFVNQIRNATTGADGSYALSIAGDNQIVFYSQSTAAGSPIIRIEYYLTGTNLYEGIVLPTGNPAIYNLASESKILIQSNVVNQNSPIFTYYDGNYNGNTNPFSQPVNVNLVKFVRINLTILNQVQRGSATSFSISTGATIRNLKNNLGN